MQTCKEKVHVTFGSAELLMLRVTYEYAGASARLECHENMTNVPQRYWVNCMNIVGPMKDEVDSQ